MNNKLSLMTSILSGIESYQEKDTEAFFDGLKLSYTVRNEVLQFLHHRFSKCVYASDYIDEECILKLWEEMIVEV